MKKDGAVYYLYGDHLGSVSAVADGSGALASKTRYHPWGTTRHTQGASPTDYAFTGQMQEGDIYFYNARWYDPVIGRFMQADTLVHPTQGIQGFDRYAYVSNNPIKFVDPTGNVACYPNGDCIIDGWNNEFIIRQQGNTCGVVAMAMTLSFYTQRKYTQSDVQWAFPWTVKIDAFGSNIYPGIGVLPNVLSAGTNLAFGSLVKTIVDKEGTINKINANLEKDLPTLILFGLPKRDVGHYVLIIGNSSEKGYLFADPHGYMSYETDFVAEYGKFTGSNSFLDIWGYEGQALVGNFVMITVYPSRNNWLFGLRNTNLYQRARFRYMYSEETK